MDFQPGNRVTVNNDIIINGQTVFAKGEQVVIEQVSPNAERPEYKYIVTSTLMGTRFQLRDADIVQQTIQASPPQVPTQPAPLQQQPTQATKHCPYCGEIVLANAIKCKHCGSDLAYQRPERTPRTQGPSLAGPLGLVPPLLLATGIAEAFAALGGIIMTIVMLVAIGKASSYLGAGGLNAEGYILLFFTILTLAGCGFGIYFTLRRPGEFVPFHLVLGGLILITGILALAFGIGGGYIALYILLYILTSLAILGLAGFYLYREYYM